MCLRKIGSAPFAPRTPFFRPPHPSATTCTTFFFYLIHMFIISFLRAPPFMITLHPRRLVFCLLGFCCIFTSLRTSTITNSAPLHTLCTILNLFYILLATPPPLINTPHLLHIPSTNHSHTPIFCFPLSPFLIKLFLFIYLFFFLSFIFFIIICLFLFIYLFIFIIIIIYYLFIYFLFIYFYLFLFFLLFLGNQIFENY